jgi:hypothetical protein
MCRKCPPFWTFAVALFLPDWGRADRRAFWVLLVSCRDLSVGAQRRPPTAFIAARVT